MYGHSGVTEERIYLGGYEIYRRRVGATLSLERQTLHVSDAAKRIVLFETKTVDVDNPAGLPQVRIRWQLDNHLGSSGTELDNSAQVISYEEYHPFGSTSFHTVNGGAEVSAKRYRYTGKERDDETGLYYYGARYYASWIGRWLSVDPAGIEGSGLNFFWYASDNPLRMIDPSGMDDKDIVNVDNGAYTEKPYYDYKTKEGGGYKFDPIEIKGDSGSNVQNKGLEKTEIVGIDEIPSYTGEFPSPLKMMWYVPKGDEVLKVKYSAKEIRSWIKDAAEYHDVPQELLAVILQQENGPNATNFQKVGQFAERSITTFAAILDKALFDIVPDKISGGSSGFANMSRATLEDAAKYTEEVYGKNALPDNVRYRAMGWDQDTRIPGDDWKADLYYSAAHLRQLIDRVMGQKEFKGKLTISDVEKITAAYNGSGPLAEKYGKDAVKVLTNAATGKGKLYFYQR